MEKDCLLLADRYESTIRWPCLLLFRRSRPAIGFETTKRKDADVIDLGLLLSRLVYFQLLGPPSFRQRGFVSSS